MRRLSALFKENAELVALSGLADSLAIAQKNWNSVVPVELQRYCLAGALKHQRLTVYAANGAVAAKIKVLLPSLLTKLQKQGLEVTSIRIEVQVKSAPRAAPKVPRRVSAKAASQLADLADELSGTALGEALARLSRRT